MLGAFEALERRMEPGPVVRLGVAKHFLGASLPLNEALVLGPLQRIVSRDQGRIPRIEAHADRLGVAHPAGILDDDPGRELEGHALTGVDQDRVRAFE